MIKRLFAAAVLMISPALARDVLPWNSPEIRGAFPDYADLAKAAGDQVDFIVFKNDRTAVYIAHGWASCGRNHCPARVVELGQVVSEFLICSNSETYRLEERFFYECGNEHYLAPD